MPPCTIHIFAVRRRALMYNHLAGGSPIGPQWAVREAANGREALDRLQQGKPDVILLEGHVMSGHDFEGGAGETGLDEAFGHRLGGGLFNRHYPARTPVGSCSYSCGQTFRRESAGSSRECRGKRRQSSCPRRIMLLMKIPLGGTLTPHSRPRGIDHRHPSLTDRLASAFLKVISRYRRP